LGLAGAKQAIGQAVGVVGFVDTAAVFAKVVGTVHLIVAIGVQQALATAAGGLVTEQSRFNARVAT
jgi:hypothetical protein